MRVIPSDQISAFESYPDCLITSGGIQYGVPTNCVTVRGFSRSADTRVRSGLTVFFLSMVAVSWPLTPKSASFTVEREKAMLSDEARRMEERITHLLQKR